MRISLWLSSTPSQPGTGLLRSIIQKGTWGRPTTLAGTGPVGWDPHITLFSFKNDFTPASLEEENGIIEDLIQRTRAIASDPKLFSASSSSWVTSTPGGSSEKAPMATFYSLPIGFSAVRKGSSYFQSVLLEVASASAAPANAPLFDLRKAARDHYASIGGPSDNDQFYPHLSLHYGVEESIREHIFQALTQHDLPAETLSSLRFVGTHLQLVKTTEDVAQWVSLASVPLCTSTSSPSAASIVLRNAMFVGGRWVTAKSGSETQVPVVNPATREVITLVPGAKAADVDEAARKAHEAFEGWSSTTGKQRAVILRKMAKEIMDRKEELAWLETLNNGKPYREAIEDIQDCSKCFSYYADRAEELDTEFGDRPVDLQEANEAFSSRVKLEAVGPCGMIIPWNYPLLMAAWKVAPALAAGCSMVLKPSEMTPLTALELAAIAQRAGLPAGVLNVITGYGPDAGAPIASHPLLSKVAFTGSVATGKRVYQAATESVKRMTLELGGKSPIIIFDDVDIDKTVEWMMVGIFFNQGQVCSATSRAIVHESIADKLIARFVEAAKKLRLGDGLHPETTLGPLINETQYKKVLDYIETGKREGAKLVCGGLPEKADELKGYFVAPTVFTGTEEGMTIWKEEIFGPVLSVKTFSTEEEALRLANNTHFGLAAAVMSKDKERCNRVASKLEAGIVWINCSQPTFIQAPWGGKKASGIGRELGPWGLMNYLEVKQMTSYESPEPYGWYNI